MCTPILAILLLLSGCGPKLFDDLAGVNLISGADFSDPGWVPDDATGTYMGFQSVSGESFNGSPAYRLEIKNLFSNGDFESTSVGSLPANWTLLGPGSANDACTIVNDAASISGKTMSFSIGSPADRISFDLAVGSTEPGGIVVGKTYLLRFSFTIDNSNQVSFSYNDGLLDVWVRQLSGLDKNVLYLFPPVLNPPDSSFLVENLASQALSINTVDVSRGRILTGRIDNLRMLRGDMPYRLRYVVPFSRSGRPNLVPGTYQFSFYVKNDSTVSPNTPNRFPASGISLAVDGATNGSFIDTTQVAVAHPTDTGVDWSQWTKVQGSFSITSIPSSSAATAPTLQLSLTSTDITYNLGRMDVGSLLIAAPRLEFVP